MRTQEMERVDAAKEAERKRQAGEQTSVQIRYEACLNRAEEGYNARWAAGCKRVAENSVRDHANCISEGILTKAQCNSTYPPHDASPRCALPRVIATELNNSLELARDRCLKESKAGL